MRDALPDSPRDDPDRDPRPAVQVPARAVRGRVPASRPARRAGDQGADRDPSRRPDGGACSRHAGGLAALPRRAGRSAASSTSAKQHVVSSTDRTRRRGSRAASSMPYDLFVGIPVHRVPDVVGSSGSPSTAGCRWRQATWRRRSRASTQWATSSDMPMAKAGVFAENAAGVVADDIAARAPRRGLEQRYEGEGNCYLEFGGGRVGKVEANFLGGPAPTARARGPVRGSRRGEGDVRGDPARALVRFAYAVISSASRATSAA